MTRHLLPVLLLCAFVSAEEPETKTTDSGLQYQVLQAGEEGTNPQPGDTATVHYTGWLQDGTKFDSSRDRELPFDVFVGIGRVIEGWDEGLQLMTVGSKFRFVIPYKLAYGEKGRGNIPPMADLTFEVELLSVKKGTVPTFRQLDHEKIQKTESGLRYEMLVEGTGAQPDPNSGIVLSHVLWNAEGALIDCAEARGRPIEGVCKNINVQVLREVALLLKVGGSCLVEAPPALAFGDKGIHPKLPGGSTTYWLLTLERIVEIPEFGKTAPENLKTTESGLGYEVIREGTGEAPVAKSVVRVHYTGWLENGKEFDSSHRRGVPAEFPLNRVIAGWTEGLQLMKVGGIYRFTIPSDLGYGAQGTGPIPGGATLIFTVELLQIVR